MKARRLISSAAFDPDDLKIIKEAFESAWAEIAVGVDNDPMAVEAARLKLANIVLSLVRHGEPVVAADLKGYAMIAWIAVSDPPSEQDDCLDCD